MTTVGYGDTFPVEPMGKVIAACAIVFGILVLALPISVVGTNFTDVYTEYKQEQEQEEKLRKRAEAADELLSPRGQANQDAKLVAQNSLVELMKEYDAHLEGLEAIFEKASTPAPPTSAPPSRVPSALACTPPSDCARCAVLRGRCCRPTRSPRSSRPVRTARAPAAPPPS